MCFASVHIAIGSIQIVQAIIGRIKSGSKIGDTTELNTSGPEFSLASDIRQSILRTLRLIFSHVELSFKSSPVLFSWIAGIIFVITIYTHIDTCMTNMWNATPERFYNSFEGAIWLNVALGIRHYVF